MGDNTIKIVRHSWIARFAVAFLVGMFLFLAMWEEGRMLSSNHLTEFQNVAQRFPHQHSYAEHPSPLEECYIVIDDDPDKLSEMPRIARDRKINPAVLKKIVASNLDFGLWGISRSERPTTTLPLHPLSIVLCQLRR